MKKKEIKAQSLPYLSGEASHPGGRPGICKMGRKQTAEGPSLPLNAISTHSECCQVVTNVQNIMKFSYTIILIITLNKIM